MTDFRRVDCSLRRWLKHHNEADTAAVLAVTDIVITMATVIAIDTHNSIVMVIDTDMIIVIIVIINRERTRNRRRKLAKPIDVIVDMRVAENRPCRRKAELRS